MRADTAQEARQQITRWLIFAGGFALACVLVLALLARLLPAVASGGGVFDFDAWSNGARLLLIACVVLIFAVSVPPSIAALWRGGGTSSSTGFSSKIAASSSPLFVLALIALPMWEGKVWAAVVCIGFAISVYGLLRETATRLDAPGRPARVPGRMTPIPASYTPIVFLLAAPVSLLGLALSEYESIRSDLLLIGFLCWLHLVDYEMRHGLRGAH